MMAIDKITNKMHIRNPIKGIVIEPITDDDVCEQFATGLRAGDRVKLPAINDHILTILGVCPITDDIIYVNDEETCRVDWWWRTHFAKYLKRYDYIKQDIWLDISNNAIHKFDCQLKHGDKIKINGDICKINTVIGINNDDYDRIWFIPEGAKDVNFLFKSSSAGYTKIDTTENTTPNLTAEPTVEPKKSMAEKMREKWVEKILKNIIQQLEKYNGNRTYIEHNIGGVSDIVINILKKKLESKKYGFTVQIVKNYYCGNEMKIIW